MKLYPVIMAGGSGTRFWPLSRKAKPKQFLPLTTGRPLIAETADRLKGLAPLSQMRVVCGAAHEKAVLKGIAKLPRRNVLVEPAARNTAPAIGLAAHEVAAEDPEGILIVLPSDQHVANIPGFQKVLVQAAKLAEEGNIVTLGIRPTRPETGYGYIQKGAALGRDGFAVAAFKEKPDLATAKGYLKSHDFFWNAGIFVFKARIMLAALREHSPELAEGLQSIFQRKGTQRKSALAKVFPSLPNISIDYAVMERATNAAVVPGDFGWSDVGSFQALAEVRPPDEKGNVVWGDAALVVDCQGCIVVSSKRPLAVVGMVDTVVVDAGDALLVVPKAQSQDVRKAVEALKMRKLDRYL